MVNCRGAPELSSGWLIPTGTKFLPELSNRPELSILCGRNPITGQQVVVFQFHFILMFLLILQRVTLVLLYFYLNLFFITDLISSRISLLCVFLNTIIIFLCQKLGKSVFFRTFLTNLNNVLQKFRVDFCYKYVSYKLKIPIY